jgi:hypothetical protein
MLAPYLSVFFDRQSDFGLPAGAVLATRSFRIFLDLACGMERGVRTQRVIASSCLFWHAD